jgi:virulence-associated protein VagC
MLNNLFGNMRSEAMRLPAAFRFVGKQVVIERDAPNRCSGPDDSGAARQDA